MIQQGLRIDIVPVSGTDTIWAAAVYSHGYENGKVELTRHMFNIPLPSLDVPPQSGEFNVWVELAVRDVYQQVMKQLLLMEHEDVSAAYAQGEEAQDKASHRM